MSRQFEYNFYKTLKQLERQIRLQPLNLGGVSSSGGGSGGPPGGFIGVLPQTRIAYDTDELETLVTASGASLLDNLNHMRYRIAALEDVPEPKHQALFTVLGDVEISPNPLKIVNHTGVTKTILSVHLDINTPPSGLDLIVDINNEGNTIFTNQSNRPYILGSGGYDYGYTENIDLNSWENNQALTADVDQVGSIIAGSDLTITIVYQ